MFVLYMQRKHSISPRNVPVFLLTSCHERGVGKVTTFYGRSYGVWSQDDQEMPAMETIRANRASEQPDSEKRCANSFVDSDSFPLILEARLTIDNNLHAS